MRSRRCAESVRIHHYFSRLLHVPRLSSYEIILEKCRRAPCFLTGIKCSIHTLSCVNHSDTPDGRTRLYVYKLCIRKKIPRQSPLVSAEPSRAHTSAIGRADPAVRTGSSGATLAICLDRAYPCAGAFHWWFIYLARVANHTHDAATCLPP